MDTIVITAIVSALAAVLAAVSTTLLTAFLTRRRKREADWRKLKLANYRACAAIVSFLASPLVIDTPGAFACRRFEPISERIATRHADTVVLAEVQQAAYGRPWHDSRPWSGTVIVHLVLKGQTDGKVFAIQRSGMGSDCDDGIPAPNAGDIWILYLVGGRGEAIEGREGALGYPIDIARREDPQLDALLSAGGVR